MKNTYIGYVSTNKLENTYLYQSDAGEFQAKCTNEAGFKYALARLGKDSRTLDKAIFICSESVRKSPILQHLKDVVSDTPGCEFIQIDTDDELNIYDDIPKILNCIEQDDRLFIDMTGGLRVTSVPMMLVFNYLQRRGNTTEAEIYSSLVNKPDGTRVGVVQSDAAGQRVMRLIDGIEEFATSARVNTLQSVLAGSENEHISALLKAMKSFSESIMLGKTNTLSGNMLELRNAINVFENDTDADAFAVLFKSMLPLIKGKFFSADKNQIDTLHLIRWCVDNELLQQALVLCTEKIPDILIEKKMIEYSGDTDKIIKQQHESLNYKLIYSELLKKNDCYIALGNVMKAIQGKEPIPKSAAIKEQKRLYPELKDAIDVLDKVDYTFANLQRKPCMKMDSAIKRACDYLTQKGHYKTPWYCVDKAFKEIILDIAQADINEAASDIAAKVAKIKDISSGNAVIGDFKINIPTDQLEKILLNYVYLKYIRNQASHAGNYEELPADITDILTGSGLSCEYTEEAISANIIKITEDIKNVKFKEEQK